MAETDTRDILIRWAVEMQGLEQVWTGGPQVLDTVAALNVQARVAARQLPMEAEPAAFVRLLDRLAPLLKNPDRV